VKLGVNGWRLRTRTGVARVLLNVLRYWTPEFVGGRFDEITVYSPVPLDDDLPIPSNIKCKVVGPDMRMLVWENLILPAASRDNVLLCPSYTRPLVTWAKTVSLIYEATQKLYPEYYPTQARFIQTPLYGWSARHSTRVVTNTHQAREDILKAYRVPGDKVRVVPLAPADVFHTNYAPEQLARVRATYAGADVPFFLYVGKLTARRNVPRLVEALAQMKALTSCRHRLVIVGLNTTNIDLFRLSSSLGIADDIKHYSYVADEDLAPLYSAAEAFVLPYSYESAASLTLLEAQAAGTPVITADTIGLRQAAGDAALFTPDVRAASLAAAMAQLAADECLRENLAERGTRNASAYSWSRCSREMLEILREAAATI
jgi:glycosyltransferase involved in cell wall biosynthesis